MHIVLHIYDENKKLCPIYLLSISNITTNDIDARKKKTNYKHLGNLKFPFSLSSPDATKPYVQFGNNMSLAEAKR